jgi:hypothetical protein
LITLTLDDVRRMGQALDAYLRSSRQEIAKTMPPDLLAALPAGAGDTCWIDERGKAHVGRWLLESHHGRLMFSWYAMVEGAPTTYRYIAFLERSKEQWRVLSMTVQTLS